jgi:hypothetical protein
MAIALFIRHKNMSSLTSSLLGRKRVQEFTGAAGVPTVDGAGPALNVKPKAQLRTKDPRDKKKIKEGDEEESIIPDDAEEVASTGEAPVPTEIGAAETGLTGARDEKEGGPEVNPNLLTTALALVAPDCTPQWDKMLSPTALPKSEKRPAAPTPEPEPTAEPTPAAKTNGPASAMDAIRLSRPGSGAKDQSIEAQAKSLVGSVIQDEPSPTVIPMSESDLLGQGKPMPDPVQSATASGVLKRFSFSK